MIPVDIEHSLHYPASKLPATWGEKGEINRKLLLAISRDHAAIRQMGAEIRMGADINFGIDFTPTPGSDPAPLVAWHQNRLAFAEATRQLYRDWFAQYKTPQSDEASYAWLMESIDKMDEPAALMARLQYEFFGQLEFNFFDAKPNNSLVFPHQAYEHIRKALPGFLDEEGATHENTVKDYYDYSVPEFQIKPRDPAHAIALVHQVMARAQEIGDSIGYTILPSTQHPHISVHKDGQCLTQYGEDGLPGSSYHMILCRMQEALDLAMPMLFPLVTKPVDDLYYMHLLEFGMQDARVTLDKTTHHYQSTIFARPNRFEFRGSYQQPPHLAFSTALITSSVLDALRTLKTAPPHTSSRGAGMSLARPRYNTHSALLNNYLLAHPRFGNSHRPGDEYQRWIASLIDTKETGYEYDPPLIDSVLEQARVSGSSIILLPNPTLRYEGTRRLMGGNEVEILPREERTWFQYKSPELQQKGREALGESFRESLIGLMPAAIEAPERIYLGHKDPWILFNPNEVRFRYETKHCHTRLARLLGRDVMDALATACGLPHPYEPGLRKA